MPAIVHSKDDPTTENDQPASVSSAETATEIVLSSTRKTPKSLLDLPAEIRLRIYRWCFAHIMLAIGLSKHGTYYRYRTCFVWFCITNGLTRYLTPSSRQIDVNAESKEHLHTLATNLLRTNNQIYLEARPCMLHELSVYFSSTTYFDDHFLRCSLSPPDQSRIRNNVPTMLIQQPFAAIRFLQVGGFADLHWGLLSHEQHEQNRLLLTIKYSMPQLQSLKLYVKNASAMWSHKIMKHRVCYLHSLSQLHVMKAFSFGRSDLKNGLDEVDVDSPLEFRLILAVLFRAVLSGLVTASSRTTSDSLQKWQEIGQFCGFPISVNKTKEAWCVVKQEMRNRLRGTEQEEEVLKILERCTFD